MGNGRTRVLTVTQVNSYIRDLLQHDFVLRQVTVQGEVSNCKYHNSGHIYFTLKDGTGALAAVMFARDRIGLRFRLQEGQQVLVSGRISVYEKTGTYQLYASAIEQAGQGDLFRILEERKARLAEMGMFAEEYKQPIPRFIRRLGVVTAPDGAAIRDIEKIARRRNPYVQVILYPAIVQGEYAVPSIVRGIRQLDRIGVDVMIVGRGGGSIEDLWAFNEEPVARAIFDCSTPVISAVGHQTDTTIADLVADRRAATPSEAAEMAVYDIASYDQELTQMKRRLTAAANRCIQEQRARIRQASYRLELVTPRHRLDNQRLAISDLQEKLILIMQQSILSRRHRSAVLAARLDGTSPLKKMSGGYAYVESEDGRALRSAAQVSPGDNVRIHVADGTDQGQITDIMRRNA